MTSYGSRSGYALHSIGETAARAAVGGMQRAGPEGGGGIPTAPDPRDLLCAFVPHNRRHQVCSAALSTVYSSTFSLGQVQKKKKRKTDSLPLTAVRYGGKLYPTPLIHLAFLGFKARAAKPYAVTLMPPWTGAAEIALPACQSLLNSLVT